MNVGLRLACAGMVFGAVACGGSAGDGSITAPPTPREPSAPVATPGPAPGPSPAPTTTPTPPPPAVPGLACIGVLPTKRAITFDPVTGEREELGKLPEDAVGITTFGVVGRELLYCSRTDDVVVRWNVDTDARVATKVSCDLVTSDGTGVYAVGRDGALRRWATLDALSTGAPQWIRRLATSPTQLGASKMGVVVVQDSRKAELVDAATGKTATPWPIDSMSLFTVTSLAERAGQRIILGWWEDERPEIKVFEGDRGTFKRTVLDAELLEAMACAP